MFLSHRRFDYVHGLSRKTSRNQHRAKPVRHTHAGPGDTYTNLPSDWEKRISGHFMVSSYMPFSGYAGLQLCIKDAYEADSFCVAKCAENLVSLLYKSTGNIYPLSEAAGIGKSLADTQFKVQCDIPALTYAHKCIWNSEARSGNRFVGSRLETSGSGGVWQTSSIEKHR